MGFNQPSSSLTSNTSGQVQAQQISNMFGNQMLTNPHHSQQLDPRHFHHNQHYISVRNSNQQQHQQFQTIRDGLGAVGPVNDQTSQQLQTLRDLNSVNLESQLQGMRSLPQVKMDPHHTDPSMFLQQQQQFLQLSRQNAEAAAILKQQRLIHLQQQQQNLLNSMPPQSSILQPQFPSQNLPTRSPVRPIYEPGTCARRLAHYLHQQQQRPVDNNIEFWKTFVAEFFAPNAKKRWCVSMYGNGRQITGVFPQDGWHCEICNRKPGRGFEATVEVLPRLFKIKYESGTLEELLYVDMPREYQNSSGQIVLDYAKAVQQSVFEKLQVVREGQLRLVFSSDLKICSWEFCARRHEELIPKKLLAPQVNQLGVALQKYQTTTQNSSSNTYVSDLQNICNMSVTSARELSKALEVPLVNDLGYTKRYVRCLQISEVVNSMKDLIDYSGENTIGPMESLAKFPRRSSSSTGVGSQRRQPDDQIQQPHLSSQQQQTAGSSASNIALMMHQNSMNSRRQNLANGSNNPCDGSGVQMPSPGSSIPQSQANLPPFHFPTPSTSNHLPHTSHGGMSAGTHIYSAGSPNISIQQPALSGDVNGDDSQSSVQKIIHDIMLSSNLSGGTVNGTLQINNNQNFNGNNVAGNINAGIGGTGFGSMANRLGQPTMVNGIQPGLANNSMSINGRVGVALSRNQSMNQRNQMLSGLGTINGFNNTQFH
ncbi:hypothetical protein Leryth_019630 [Lithospermum erythrorhizon]|nr:hypothetical protein Leryth_019630 [Lithospermum erythrorhizon]